MSSNASNPVPADPSTPADQRQNHDQAPSADEEPKWNFPLSPIPANPLGEGRYIKTAAALIIGSARSAMHVVLCTVARPLLLAVGKVRGDEILNGKTLDRNSNYFARYCFEHGVDLRRIEVVPDEEDDIVEAARRLVKTFDFVITSGGIGPTHDDITYASLAKAFDQPLEYHQETLRRMGEMTRHRTDIAQQTPEQRAARERMALFPAKAEVLFIAPDIWVVSALSRAVPCARAPHSHRRSGCRRVVRAHRILTEGLPESSIAPYLTELQARTKGDGVRVGSYPLLAKGVYVSLIGRDADKVRALADEVVQKLQGRLVSEEEAKKEKSVL
ncbi:hypothetical protein BN946_scf184601.g22 [Trametes cinnabarina]|uniref:MoaB/Mog domain-containing protein n=1 Tax=Pycnoporus cinnabarinus TaxID=5643 RepID=A0A060SCQ6_PYCCI|nr:hypothetical protein BN946_scf184601.g22 [Trametes cinnabarina]